MHIINIDANNTYGYGMPKFLLRSEFKWIDLEYFQLNKCN